MKNVEPSLTILLLRTSNIDDSVIGECADAIREIFININIDIQKDFVKIPGYLYDDRRGQYHAEGIVYFISKYFSDNRFALLIASVDAYVPGLNFVFGLAVPSIRTAAVFTHRLKMLSDYNNYILRVKKEVIHELGHLLGLNHCSNTTCVMRFSNSVLEVDEKSYLFCSRCSAKLINMGFRLKSSFHF